MHHPINQNSPHKPIKVFLFDLNIIWLNDVFFLSVLQSKDSLNLGAHVYLSLKNSKFLQLFFVINKRNLVYMKFISLTIIGWLKIIVYR